MSALEHALRYAEQGMPVFPCNPPNKKPLVSGGFKSASLDPAQIHKWWAMYPNAMIGVPTGAASGIVVLDVDVKNGHDGIASLKAYADVPETLTIQTPSGGLHYLFKHDPDKPMRNSAGVLGDGLDVRGDGGYVIMAGSVNAIGKAYERVKDCPLAPMPDWLFPLRVTDKTDKTDFNPQSSVFGPSEWAKAALAGEVGRVATAGAGKRNDTLNRAAFSLGQIVGGGSLDERVVTDALMAAAHQNGLADESEKAVTDTILSGLASGKKDPRTEASKAAINVSVSAHGAPWSQLPPWLKRPCVLPAPLLPLDDIVDPSLANWIKLSAESKSCPSDYVFGALLAVTGSLLGNSRWVTPWEGWQEPPILFTMAIGAPSSGKSPGIDASIKPLKEIEKPLRREAEIELKKWKEKADLADLRESAWREQVKKAEKLQQEIPEKPKDLDVGLSPHLPRLVISDATIEKIGMLLNRQPKGSLQYRDELSGFLENMARYSAGSDRAFWLEAYGGRSFSVDRVGRESLTIDRLAIGLVGGIQPDKLNSLLMIGDDDGLMARFLPFWPEAIPVMRPTKSVDSDFMQRALTRLHKLEMFDQDTDDARPWFIHLDDDARNLMDDWRVACRAYEGDANGLLLSFIGKMPGFAARLSLLFAYLDWACSPQNGDEPREVTKLHFGRACHFLESYALPMAQRAYGAGSIPKAEKAAVRLVDLIRVNRWMQFSSREVLRLDRAGLDRKADLDPALQALEDADAIRPIGPETKGKGRPERSYQVNPALMEALT